MNPQHDLLGCSRGTEQFIGQRDPCPAPPCTASTKASVLWPAGDAHSPAQGVVSAGWQQEMQRPGGLSARWEKINEFNKYYWGWIY